MAEAAGKKRLVQSNTQQSEKKVLVLFCNAVATSLHFLQSKLVSRKKRAGFGEELFKETTYYIRDGKTRTSSLVATTVQVVTLHVG